VHTPNLERGSLIVSSLTSFIYRCTSTKSLTAQTPRPAGWVVATTPKCRPRRASSTSDRAPTSSSFCCKYQPPFVGCVVCVCVSVCVSMCVRVTVASFRGLHSCCFLVCFHFDIVVIMNTNTQLHRHTNTTNDTQHKQVHLRLGRQHCDLDEGGERRCRSRQDHPWRQLHGRNLRRWRDRSCDDRSTCVSLPSSLAHANNLTTINICKHSISTGQIRGADAVPVCGVALRARTVVQNLRYVAQSLCFLIVFAYCYSFVFSLVGAAAFLACERTNHMTH
jgi:hypothetical protein